MQTQPRRARFDRRPEVQPEPGKGQFCRINSAMPFGPPLFEYTQEFRLVAFLDQPSQFPIIITCILDFVMPGFPNISFVQSAAKDFAFPVPMAQMKRFCRMFGGKAEVIAEYQGNIGKKAATLDAADIMALLRRRPCTLKDIADGLSLHPTQVAKALEHLRDDGKIVEKRIDDRIYYEPAKPKREQNH